MNILNKYVKRVDDITEYYAECLLELYTYAVIGSMQENIDDETKNRFESDKRKYRKEIFELIKKGKR